MHRYVEPLQNIPRLDRMLAGGKAVNLGHLIRAELPVPPGFIVLTTAYEHFVAVNGLQEEIVRLAHTVTVSEPATAEKAGDAIRLFFEQGTLPEDVGDDVLTQWQQLNAPAVAVRSSATAEDLPGASFAGLQDTFLNVTGAEDLLHALCLCWSSLWSARALIYRLRQQIAPETVQMAVIVQRMVASRSSGILFTCNPVTGSQQEMIINAAWGLGEAIVSGRVSSDEVVVDKESGQVKQMLVADKMLMTVSVDSGVVERSVPPGLRKAAVLSKEQVVQLFRIGRTIEELFQAPQDIEWAFDDNQVFVLQARPITTRPPLQVVTVPQWELPVPGDDDWDRQTRSTTQPFDLWTRVNLGENFPNPVTPLSSSLWPTLMFIGRMPTPAELFPDVPPSPGFVERFYGRIYVNEGLVKRFAIKAGIPSSFLSTTWGSSGRGPHSADDNFHFLRLLRSIPSLAKMGGPQARQKPNNPKAKAQKLPRLSGERLFRQVDRWVDEFQQADLQQLDDRLLWDRWFPLWLERGEGLRSMIKAEGLAFITFYILQRHLKKWTGETERAMTLVQALSGVYTAEVAPALWCMAQQLRALHLEEIVQCHPAEEALAMLQASPEAQPFMAELQEFLQRHGYRCPNDAELRNPRWEDAPDQVIELIKSYFSMDDDANPVVREQHLQQERQDASNMIAGRLNPIRRLIFRWLLVKTQKQIRLRDNTRSYVAKFIYPMRLLVIELGRRWTARGWLSSPDDIFFLTLSEIDDSVRSTISNTKGKELARIASDRRLALDYWQTIIAPAALGPGGIPLSDPEPDSPFLQGLPASAGRVRGTARLVRSIDEAGKLSPGDILVTQSTDPGWTPIFPLVAGLVLEVGGQLSHGAIIAREYGIPAVINVQGALQFIQEGQSIEVDGTSGRVHLY